MSEMKRPSRRTVLRGTGAVAATGATVSTVAACGSEDGSKGTEMAVDKVPVGSGAIDSDAKVVVSQPKEGEYKAFSTVCTHAKCPMTKIEGETLFCSCHGSEFNALDGSVTKGPATEPLPEKKTEVKDGKVVVS